MEVGRKPNLRKIAFIKPHLCSSYKCIYQCIIISTTQHLFDFDFESTVQYVSAQSCLTFCDFLDCSPPGSSVHGTFQARILEWISISSSRESFPSSNQTLFAYICCIAGIFFATEPLEKPNVQYRESENTEIHEDDYNACSVQFSRSVMPNSLRPHGLQHARLPCPSPTPRVDSKSCPLNR